MQTVLVTTVQLPSFKGSSRNTVARRTQCARDSVPCCVLGMRDPSQHLSPLCPRPLPATELLSGWPLHAACKSPHVYVWGGLLVSSHAVIQSDATFACKAPSCPSDRWQFLRCSEQQVVSLPRPCSKDNWQWADREGGGWFHILRIVLRGDSSHQRGPLLLSLQVPRPSPPVRCLFSSSRKSVIGSEARLTIMPNEVTLCAYNYFASFMAALEKKTGEAGMKRIH